MHRKLVAEFIGTTWLVLGGCGSAVLAAAFPQLGIGFAGVSLAFGLTVLTMAFAIGHVSGCHLNPAVSVGLWAGGRFKASELPLYVIAQVLGAIARCRHPLCNRERESRLRRSCRLRQQWVSAIIRLADIRWRPASSAKSIMTFGFVFVILGSTHGNAPRGFAPIAIGLCLTLIHLISIPVTNTSVNPARSTGPAIFAGGWALEQLWLFWIAPLIGAAIGGVVYRWVGGDEPRAVEVSGER